MNVGDILAIFRVVDEASGPLSNIQKQVQKTSGDIKTFGTSLGDVMKVAGGLAVVGFAKQVVNFTGELTDLSAQTGITVRDLQILNDVGAQVGVGMSELAMSAQRMSKNIEEGNKETLAGLQKLGLGYAELKRMDPGRQFFTIAEALRKVEDQGRLVSIGTEIMGRGFMRVLPIVKEDLDAAGKSAEMFGRIIGDEAVKAGDDFGDSITKFWTALKAATGQIIGPLLPALTTLVTVLGSILGVVGKVVGGFMNWIMTLGKLKDVLQQIGLIKITPPDLPEAPIKRTTEAFQALALAEKEVARIEDELTKGVHDQWKRAAEEKQRMLEEHIRIGKELEAQFIAAGQAYQMGIGERLGAGQAAADEQFGAAIQAAKSLQDPKFIMPMVANLMPVVEGNFKKATNVGVFTGLKDAVAQFPALIVQSLTGGGGLSGALQGFGSLVGTTIAGNIAKNLTKNLTGMFGDLINSVLPGIGAFLGPAISWIGNKLFKVEGKKVNDLRDAFIAAAGGLDALNRKAHTAGMTLDALLKADTVEEYEAAIAALNKELDKTAQLQAELAALQKELADRQVMDWQKAEELIAKYGGTLDTLGQQFVAAKQAASWKEVWDDWQTLIDMGADVGGVLVTMKDEIQALVQQSMKIGTEIPAQFKPLIEELIRTGQLFDENGEAITDISQLKFGEALVSEVDKIIAKIDELIEALTGHLIPALGSIPDHVNIKVGYEVEDFPNVGPAEVPGYATGTGGRFLDFGAGTLVTLHGKERVMTQAEAASAPIQITVVSTLDGREVARNQVRYLPGQLALAGL